MYLSSSILPSIRSPDWRYQDRFPDHDQTGAAAALSTIKIFGGLGNKAVGRLRRLFAKSDPGF